MEAKKRSYRQRQRQINRERHKYIETHTDRQAEQYKEN